MNRTFPGTFDSIEEIIGYSREFFEKERIKSEVEEECLLLLRDSISLLIVHSNEDDPAPLIVSIKKRFGSVNIRLTEVGDAFDVRETDILEARRLKSMGSSEEGSDVIASLLSGRLEKRYSYKRVGVKNRITIGVPVSGRHSQLIYTITALIMAIVLGVAVRNYCPQGFIDALSTILLVPIKTMFLNSLKIIIAPVVFFSLVTCVSQFTDFGELGKIGGKIILLFVITTMLAIAIAFAVFALLQPGEFGSVVAEDLELGDAKSDISIIKLIVGIVPSNYIRPFVESNMLQLIFLAVISGIASGMIGKYSIPVQSAFAALNELFLKITTMIINLIPVAVFASIMNLVLHTGQDALLELLSFTLCYLATLFGLLCMYMLVLLLIGRVNPFRFVAKYFPVMLTAFSISSSNALMPHNMKACRESFGVSEKVYSLSIPLGATINMAGSATYLVLSALFLSRIYGIVIPSSMYVALCFSAFVLAVGSPGVTGAAFICLAVLLNQLGVPAEALGLLMGVDPIFSMLRTAFNTFGDVAVSVTVARMEDKIDMAVYNS